MALTIPGFNNTIAQLTNPGLFGTLQNPLYTLAQQANQPYVDLARGTYVTPSVQSATTAPPPANTSSGGGSSSANRNTTTPPPGYGSWKQYDEDMAVRAQQQAEQERQYFAQLDSLYNEGRNLLTGYEGTLRQNQQESLAGLDRTKANLLQQLEGKKTQAEELAAQQQFELGQTASSAYDQATRAFNQAKNNAAIRYGAGSSAGPYVQDLAYKEFLRSQGNIGAQSTAGQSKIQLAKSDIFREILQAGSTIESSYNDEIDRVNREFRDGLQRIAELKYQNEAAKTTAKIELLQQTINASKQAQTIRDQARVAIGTYAATLELAANNSLAPKYTALAGLNPAINVPQSTFGQAQQAPNYLSGLTGYNPTGTYYRDQYGRLIDENGNLV